jgi:hypothetical protein
VRTKLADVVDLGRYRERRTVRRVSAYLVVFAGVAAAALRLWQLRDGLDRTIRRAAELLPDEVSDAGA